MDYMSLSLTKLSTIKNRRNKQNKNVDNSHNDHRDGIPSKVHNTVDQKVRQPIFKYLLMADIDCSWIHGVGKKAVPIPTHKLHWYVKSLASLIVEVIFFFLHNLLSSSLLYKNINIKVQNYNFTCSVWVWNLFAHIERGASAERVRE